MDVQADHPTTNTAPMDTTVSAVEEGHDAELSARHDLFPIDDLPDIVHKIVLEKLTFKELIRAGLVSCRWFANCNHVLRGVTTLAVGKERCWNLQTLCPLTAHTFESYSFVDIKENSALCKLIGRMPNLLAFYVSGDHWYGAKKAVSILDALSRCPRLEHISIPSTGLLDFDFTKFTALKCTDNIQFADCPNLEFVRFWENRVQRVTTNQLSKLVPKLKWIECSFREDRVEKIVTIVSKGVNLEKLHIVNPELGMVTTICSNLTNVRSLSAHGSIDEWMNIKTLEKLESLRLEISDIPVSVEEFRQILKPIGHRLKRLDLTRCIILLEFHVPVLDLLHSIVEMCPNLECLEFHRLPHIDNGQALLIIARLPNLRSLTISALTYNEEQLRGFLKSSPNLQVFSTAMTRTSSEMYNRLRLDFPNVLFWVGAYKDPRIKFVRKIYN